MKADTDYEIYFEDFKTDTGLDPKVNVAEYLLYVNTRFTEHIKNTFNGLGTFMQEQMKTLHREINELTEAVYKNK